MSVCGLLQGERQLGLGSRYEQSWKEVYLNGPCTLSVQDILGDNEATLNLDAINGWYKMGWNVDGVSCFDK